jgi:hypothetical protein
MGDGRNHRLNPGLNPGASESANFANSELSPSEELLEDTQTVPDRTDRSSQTEPLPLQTNRFMNQVNKVHQPTGFESMSSLSRKSSAPECPICLLNLGGNGGLFITPACKHKFCRNCIQNWVQNE